MVLSSRLSSRLLPIKESAAERLASVRRECWGNESAGAASACVLKGAGLVAIIPPWVEGGGAASEAS